MIFAYGSNMNINRLRERVPSATKYTNAYIKGYQLVCNKISRKDGSAKANIAETGNNNDIVWGVLFVIDNNEKPNLDRLEGLGNGYEERTLTFFDPAGNTHEAQAYIAFEDQYLNNALNPYDWYHEFILSGAIQAQLPQKYIDSLKMIQSTVDSDLVRRCNNFAIINGQ